MSYFTSYQNILSLLINKVLIAAIIVFVGFIAARIVSKLSQKFLKNIQCDKFFSRYFKINISIEELVSVSLLYLIDIIVIVAALKYLNFANSVINVISVIFIVIIVIFILLSIKDLIPNLISGLIFQQKNLIKIGDILEMEDIKGRVIQVNLLDTKIETKRGDIMIIPNSNFSNKTYRKLKRL